MLLWFSLTSFNSNINTLLHAPVTLFIEEDKQHAIVHFLQSNPFFLVSPLETSYELNMVSEMNKLLNIYQFFNSKK